MKIFIIFAVLIIGFIIFYLYEAYSFDRYIKNSKSSYDMKIIIDKNAPVLSSNQVEINAPIDVVWNKLTNIKDWTSWQKDVTKTIVYGNIAEETNFDWKANGLSFSSKIHTCVPKKYFGWTGKTFGAYAIHNWNFESDGNKTTVKVEECLRGILPKLFKNYFQDNLDKSIVKNLNELKIASEQDYKALPSN